VRAATTAVLPYLSTYLLVGKMFEGVSSAYTTFVSYDEVAHHSGVDRSDSFRVLSQIDEQLAWIMHAARRTERAYEFVVLSDHGQSQGATFKQRYGESLTEVIGRAVDGDANASAQKTTDEGVGNLKVLVGEMAASPHWSARSMGSLARRLSGGGDGGSKGASGIDEEPRTVTCASGNLALVYFTAHPHRMTMEEINREAPDLIDSLVGHPGVGFVMVRSEDKGPIVLGSAGLRVLQTGSIEGEDPLGAFGANAATHLLELDTYPAVGDLVINSLYDPEWDEVAAFEELVGSHGGLGGNQTQAFIMFPAQFDPDRQLKELVGAPAVHRLLADWLARAKALPRN
jgi:hypothetical protein